MKDGKTLDEELPPVIHCRKRKVAEAVIGDETDPIPGDERNDRLEQQIICLAGEALRSSFAFPVNRIENGKYETPQFLPGESDPLQMNPFAVDGPDIEAAVRCKVVE